MKRHTMPTKLRCLAASRAGDITAAICAREGVPLTTLCSWAKQAGLSFTRSRFALSDRTAAVDAVRAGASYRVAAAEVSADAKSVMGWCRAAGVRSVHAYGQGRRRGSRMAQGKAA